MNRKRSAPGLVNANGIKKTFSLSADGDGERVGERLMGNEKEEKCNNQSLTISLFLLLMERPPKCNDKRDNGGRRPGLIN
jgi:hypothetical protein